MTEHRDNADSARRTPLERLVYDLVGWCLDNKLIVFLLVALVTGWGIAAAPFDWDTGPLPRNPIPVDAIPDLGENQQIVFTEWPGRSPQDVDDQVTYPLTTALLGLSEVKTVRSYSYFGFSTIYVIFTERADFYDSRSRILEKLGSLPGGLLPEDANPVLGPDATALGQVFWYTLEGRDEEGRPAGGWDPAQLRTIQDFAVRDALMSAGGVAEVASVGGFEQEYQVDVDPDALRLYGITLQQVSDAVAQSNRDVGARSLEINRVEYVVRGVGTVAGLADLEQSVVTVREDDVPVLVRDVATVQLGPALRRGALDKEGAEAVGGVVVVRDGENPLAVIERVKARIVEIAPSLPSRTLPDGRTSRVTVVPFYDRTKLIHETLDTLRHALGLEILVTILVVIVLVRSLRGGLLVAGLLPLSVLAVFIAMKLSGVDANIVALSGIAIAIGTMVDMGVVLVENILARRESEKAAGRNDRPLRDLVREASSEVGGAVLTAVATTIIGFLPVFTLAAAEGKLFRPLAFTKTFALLAAVLVAVMVIPPAAHLLLRRRGAGSARRSPAGSLSLLRRRPWLVNVLLALAVALLLAASWRPLGPGSWYLWNALFVVLTCGGVLLGFLFFQRLYPRALRWCLDHKALFLVLPLALVVSGSVIWHGLGREFMPPLDEGSFLYMPTTMPHASIGESMDVLRKLDLAIGTVPEVEMVVGKLGRARTALDPAPISMVETVVNYKPEYAHDAEGNPVRQWRDEIESEQDIWEAIVAAARLPGTTSAPRLQPIGARLVMLQSGMRAPMGVKIQGPTLETIESAALAIEEQLKQVPEINPAAVVADRVVGKPYLDLVIDRAAIARHGLTVDAVQRTLSTAIAGRTVTTTTEGRRRFDVRVRYQREKRDDLDAIRRILVHAPGGVPVPLGELVDIRYQRGPMTIKSEDTFLVGYVIFDKQPGYAEVEVVEASARHLDKQRAAGALRLPEGVSYAFTGSFESQIRSQKTLSVVLPVALVLIFVVLFLQFRSVSTTAMVFGGVFVAWAGGFVLLWLYGQPWFLEIPFVGDGLRDLFRIHPLNLSVAVWVGFLALFGIATDDGVLMATYLDQRFVRGRPAGRNEIRIATVEAATRRVRPALMTSATTILALLPVLTLTGRGADLMVPMAIPSFGGMLVALLTLFLVPVLYAFREERRAGGV